MKDHIIDRVFQQPKRDMKDPLNSAYYNRTGKIANQALASWLTDFGGHYVIEQITESIRANLKTLIVGEEDKVVDRIREIKSQLYFVSLIEKAFEDEEKRKEENLKK